MEKIALFTLGWFVGSGIAAHIIIITRIIQLTIRKKGRNETSK